MKNTIVRKFKERLRTFEKMLWPKGDIESITVVFADVCLYAWNAAQHLSEGDREIVRQAILTEAHSQLEVRHEEVSAALKLIFAANHEIKDIWEIYDNEAMRQWRLE